MPAVVPDADRQNQKQDSEDEDHKSDVHDYLATQNRAEIVAPTTAKR
jgi:polygalacturonase